jgi:hypothetical protein
MLIGVVAHDQREALAQPMIDAVEADFVSLDHGLPTVIGCADNHILVLKTLDGAAKDEWCIVLEDDAIPVDDFREHAERALAKTDAQLVGLYLGTGNPLGVVQAAVEPAVRAAEDSQSAWIVADWFLATVGYAVRSTLLPDLIADISERGGPVDNRINEWTHAAGLQTWYTQPSLVDHEDNSSVLSSFTPYPRYAHRYGARKQWNKRTVAMGRVEGWSPASV